MLLKLSNDDALLACEAIATQRYWSHCRCDPDVGFTCSFCAKRRRADKGYQGSIETCYRWAKKLIVHCGQDKED